MKTATALTLVAIGAILAFAVNAHMAYLDLHVAGAILILTGAAGAIVPRSSSWLRTRAAPASDATPAGGRPLRPPGNTAAPDS
jgi:hypothetical protein